MTIDKKDKRILDLLQQDSSLTTHKISKKTAIPITTVHNRIKKLKDTGVIKRFTIDLDYQKLGKPLSGFILITINYDMHGAKPTNQLEIAKKIKKFDEIRYCAIMTGTTDLLVQFTVSTLEELNDFIINKLRMIEGIDKTQTMMTLKEA